MNQRLTVAYVTSRKDSKLEWFLESLSRQITTEDKIQVFIISLHCQEKRELIWVCPITGKSITVLFSPVKPNVWQGPHRLTKEDWFAASNARNTSLCMAPDGWLAYCDDLSVLLPGWLNSVREAMAGNYIVCGAYQKVKKLVVENGEVKSLEPFDGGMDSRLKHVTQTVTDCPGNYMFGCSLAGPVEAFLTVNGWPEMCDGLGSEDYCMGLVLRNAGFTIKYDTRMMTYESEEHHHIEPAFRREDWHKENGVSVIGGNGADDKSHCALNIALQSTSFPNHYNIRELRAKVLAGEPFPIDLNPRHEWYSGKPLEEL